MAETSAKGSNVFPVLIVGAGPTGLTLACELARRGVAFRLIESASKAPIGSRSKGLQPRSLEVFDNLGIVDRVIENGWLAIPMHVTNQDGQVLRVGAIPDSLRGRPDIPYTASLITPAWRTEEALRLRLKEFGGAVEFSSELVTFTQSDEFVSAVILKEGGSETVMARWLVGCDGGHSVVRKQSGIIFEGETRDDVRMIIADLKVGGLNRDAWHMWRHEEGTVMLCPLPSTDLFQYQAYLGTGQDPALSLINLQAIFSQRSGRTDIHLHEPEWSTVWRANIRLANRYRERRAFIAGDAAHVHSPAGGQGMNTGIQDAHNLGWKLAAVENGASPTLLASYEAERAPIGAHILALSNALLNHSRQPGGLNVRRDESTIQLSLNYRESDLARDDRGEDASLRAGDRAPDATRLMTVGGERRLFDLTRGGRFTVLCFAAKLVLEPGPFDIRIFNVVKQPVSSNEIADPEGQLTRFYGATDRTVILIRPDGYIGLISDAGDTSAIREYLGSLGLHLW